MSEKKPISPKTRLPMRQALAALVEKAAAQAAPSSGALDLAAAFDVPPRKDSAIFLATRRCGLPKR